MSFELTWTSSLFSRFQNLKKPVSLVNPELQKLSSSNVQSNPYFFWYEFFIIKNTKKSLVFSGVESCLLKNISVSSHAIISNTFLFFSYSYLPTLNSIRIQSYKQKVLKMFSKKKEGAQQQTETKASYGNSLSPSSPKNNPVVTTAGKVGKSHHEFFKVMDKHKQEDKMRPITLEQLSKHKTYESAWLSLNGTVYDVTVYMNYHPGGKILLDGCGKQCMDLFNAHHPWVNATYLLAKYKIGFLSK